MSTESMDGKPQRGGGIVALLSNFFIFAYVASYHLLAEMGLASRASVILAGCVLLMALLRGLQTGHLRVPRLWFVPWLFVGFAAISVMWSVDEKEALDPFMSLFAAVLGGFAVWLGGHNGLSWKPVIWGSMVGAVVVTLSTLPEVAAHGLHGRVVGITKQPNGVALLLSYAAVLVWCAPFRLPKWLHWLAGALVLFAAVFTASRKVLLFILAMLLIFARRMLSVKRGRILIAVGVTALGLFCLVVGSASDDLAAIESLQVFKRTAGAFDGREESYRIRQGMFNEALDMWSERPVFGWGLGQFAVKSAFGVYSHSNYTELLADTGIVGFALYYLFHACLLLQATLGALRGSRTAQTAIVLLGMVFMLDFGMIAFSAKASWMLLFFIADLAGLDPARPCVGAAGDSR